MRFQLLGHVQGWADGRPVSLGVRKQRFVLALLALEVNRLVPVSRLVDLVWPDSPPTSARAMIHTYVSGLRAVLDRHRATASGVTLISESAGYELRCDAMRVDAHEFRELVSKARAEPDSERQVTLFTEALALWRGPALAGVTGEPTRTRLCRHLDEARLVAIEDRAEAMLRSGRHRQLVDDVIALADAHPQRQRLTGHLMLALHRCGRAAEALRAYERTRRELADELGLDPGDDLQRLHQAILRDDPDLAGTPAAPAGAPAQPVAGTAPSAVATSTGAPAVAAPDRPMQLPADPAVFTGRGPELSHLFTGWPIGSSEPPGTVVLTAIEGMAGIGKTALAVHAAHRLAKYFPDGQIFIDLHGFTPGAAPVAPGDALDRMLRAFGVPGKKIPDGLDDRAALWRTTLTGRRVLLVLDNAADDRQIVPLLPGSVGCLVLVTSRRRLADLDDATPLALDVLPTAEAVALFARISGTAEPADQVARIVELCGRLPLAVAIAAARLRGRPSWTPAHLAERLGDHQGRLAELDAGQRSVTAAIELSYRQLGEDQPRLFRLLGIHFGQDIDTYAAAALAGLDPRAADRLLEALVDAHLLQQPRPGRYQMHDLVRSYAAQSAEAAEPVTERRVALTRLLDHYRYATWLACETLYRPAHRRRPRLLPPGTALPDLGEPDAAGSLLDNERANLLAAAAYATRHGWPTHAIHLSQIMHRHYEVRSLYADAEQLHGMALNAAIQSRDQPGEARALNELGTIHFHQGRYDRANELLHQALELYKQIGEPLSGPSPRSTLGLVCLRLGRYDEARDHLEQALDYYRRTDDPSGQASVLLNLGILNGQTGHWAEAESYFGEALRFARATGNRTGEGHALTNLSIIFGASERYPEAIEHLRQALVVHRETHSHKGQADTLGNLGLIYDRMGRPAEAMAHHEEALALYRRTGERAGEVESLNDLGRSLCALNRPDEAAAHHREAHTLAIRSGDRYQEAQAYDGLGHVQHALGDPAGARGYWQRALDLLTDLGLPEADKVREQLDRLGEDASQLT